MLTFFAVVPHDADLVDYTPYKNKDIIYPDIGSAYDNVRSRSGEKLAIVELWIPDVKYICSALNGLPAVNSTKFVILNVMNFSSVDV